MDFICSGSTNAVNRYFLHLFLPKSFANFLLNFYDKVRRRKKYVGGSISGQSEKNHDTKG